MFPSRVSSNGKDIGSPNSWTLVKHSIKFSIEKKNTDKLANSLKKEKKITSNKFESPKKESLEAVFKNTK